MRKEAGPAHLQGPDHPPHPLPSPLVNPPSILPNTVMATPMAASSGPTATCSR